MSEEWPEIGRSLNDFGGDWDAYVDACYESYHADFYKRGRPWPIAGQRLGMKRHPLDEEGRCNTFWHLVSEGSDEAERLPALSRLERIGWPKALLEEFCTLYPRRSSDRICWWRNGNGGGMGRYLIAVADFSYVVIFSDRGDYVLLWTAYPVEYRNRRDKLRREFETFWSAVPNGT